MDKMMIKVCGMRDPENVRQVAELGVDMMGFIFYPKSPRTALNGKDFQLKYFPRTEADKNVTRVGVFVNPPLTTFFDGIKLYDIDVVQFHGHESPDVCLETKRLLAYLANDVERRHPALNDEGKPIWVKPVKIIKALNVSTVEDVKKCKEYVGSVDYFLFDTKTKLAGGSGQQFDWSILDAYDGDVPFLLSGGIGPEDAERIKEFHHPKCIGIDLNSKFEISPGVKDVEKLREFISKVRG